MLEDPSGPPISQPRSVNLGSCSHIPSASYPGRSPVARLRLTPADAILHGLRRCLAGVQSRGVGWTPGDRRRRGRSGVRVDVPDDGRQARRVATTAPDFGDEMGEGVEVELPGTGGVGRIEFLQFRKKAEHFLKQHLGEAVVARARPFNRSRSTTSPTSGASSSPVSVMTTRSPRPARRPAASACSSAHSLGWTVLRARQPSPTSSASSDSARIRSNSST